MIDKELTDDELVEKLHYLIECLQKETPQYSQLNTPDDLDDSFNLFRALCNVRMPQGDTGHTLPEKFYTIETEVLQTVTARKGITDVANLPRTRLDPRLSLWQGDITTVKADAIVDAANSGLLGCFAPLHGCIDNMIHTMAGVELREECYQIMRLQHIEEPTGDAKITLGYNLPARHVIHTVGPIVPGVLTDEQRHLLASCYSSVLDCADGNGLTSVVFCCISTGVFHFPQEKASHIAVATVRDWLDAHEDSSVRHVVFNVFKDEDRDYYQRILDTTDDDEATTIITPIVVQ